MAYSWGFLALAILVVAQVGSSPYKAASKDRNNKSYKVVCYHGTWSVYRPGAGKFGVEDIDPNLCTHAIYTFVGLGANNQIRVLDGYLDLVENWGRGNIQKFNNLRNANPHLTSILAIGGWNEGSVKYSEMARDPSKRKIFVDSTVQFLLKHDFDGLDLDWEYPANRGGVPEDKGNFVALCQELRVAFDEHGFLLTAAVSAGKPTIDTAYDIPRVSQLLDFINLMAYDFHGGWEKTTGHNSPLFARPDESGNEANLNMDWAAKYWVEKGCPKSKLVLGMATYGRAFTLQNPNNNGLGAPAPSAGRAGPYTREAGMLGFNEICEAQNKESWTIVWDKNHMAPYAHKDNQWVGYDDVTSIGIKAAYAKSQGLAGAMIWSIETDDFRGNCFGQKYPLLNTINKVLSGDNVDIPTAPPTQRPQTGRPGEDTRPPTPPTTTTRKPFTSNPGELACHSAGFFRNPSDCAKFYQCVENSGGFTIVSYDCGAGTVFDETNGVCTWPGSVPGC